MISDEIPLRYAKALGKFATAEELSVLDTLTSGAALYFFASPQIKEKEKQTVLQNSVGKHLSTETMRFLFILMERGRFSFLKDILELCRKVYQDKEGVLDAHLETAFPMDHALSLALQEKLERLYKKKVNLSLAVSSTLIGGGKLTIGNTMLDFSIKRKLGKLEQKLRGGEGHAITT